MLPYLEILKKKKNMLKFAILFKIVFGFLHGKKGLDRGNKE